MSPITTRIVTSKEARVILKNYGLPHDVLLFPVVLLDPSFTDINFTGNPVNYAMLHDKVDSIYQELIKFVLQRSHRVFSDFKTARAGALLSLIAGGLVGNSK